MKRLTKKEKIIQFLIDNGIYVTRYGIIETKKFQKPGTIVINECYLPKDERIKLDFIDSIAVGNGKYMFNCYFLLVLLILVFQLILD